MLKFIFLTQQFYKDYKNCLEIEQKQNRPYIMALATINNVDFAIPLRSNIKHANVLWTDKSNNCGLDFSKAVIIMNKPQYIDNSTTPTIRQNEFNSLKGKDHIVKIKMESYLNKYIKAYNNQRILRNKMFCSFSTLQYFHKELGIEELKVQ
jgi:protein AbiQ